MTRNSYEIIETIGGFEEGEILDVTARFGDWHTYDLKLESRPTEGRSKTVVVTESDVGFSEAEILDETARIGDWHEYALSFDPVSGSADPDGQIEITVDELHEIAEPVES
ncbi:hypothetical protein ACFQL3_16680 [Natronoarchaeum sp. GCM10025321]|uniref:hypothetical protein n=1 Tax=Natronoarchaeum sp. GCM10025321 TaxID=3252684 RepID=UPI003609421E